MEDVANIDIAVNSTTSTVPAAGLSFNNLIKVSRGGVGLRIVEVPTSTITGNDIYSFEWRFINPLVSLPSGANITKSVGALSIVEYRTSFFFGDVVEEGMTYIIVFLGTPVVYVAQAGDTDTEVRAGLKALIDATTYSHPTTTSLTTFMGQLVLLLDALTGSVPSCTIFVRPAGYYYSKSGLTTVVGGAYYIISIQEFAGYTIPTIPALNPSYDWDDFILPPYGLEAYLFDSMYPIEDINLLTLEGTADITGNPSLSFSLNPNEVALDEVNDVYQFGTAFASGTPEIVSIIYINS